MMTLLNMVQDFYLILNASFNYIMQLLILSMILFLKILIIKTFKN